MNLFDKLAVDLGTGSKIAIIGHSNPDGDAIGASLGLSHYFKQLGHSVEVIMPNQLPDYVDYLPGYSNILIYREAMNTCNLWLEKCSHVFCLDFNSLDRIDELGVFLRTLLDKKVVVMIDHHLEPENFTPVFLHDTTASSASELVFRAIVEHWNMQQPIKQEVLDCLYTGILSDTGGLSYALSPRLMRLLATMYEMGVSHPQLSGLFFDTYSEKKLRLLGYSLYQRLEVLTPYNLALFHLDATDHARFDIKRGDTEGIVNHLLRIKGVKVAIFIAERKNEVKISMRSKGNFSVQEICAQYFNGGGHKNASGGTSNLSLADTLSLIKNDIINTYKSKLTTNE